MRIALFRLGYHVVLAVKAVVLRLAGPFVPRRFAVPAPLRSGPHIDVRAFAACGLPLHSPRTGDRVQPNCGRSGLSFSLRRGTMHWTLSR